MNRIVTLRGTKLRHSREGGNPAGGGAASRNWIPAFAGMTKGWGAGLALLALAGCSAAAQEARNAPAAPVVAAAPAGPPAGGPPPLPRPMTLVTRPGATGGEALFVRNCAQCHGPNGMGTGLLGRRVQPALLEERDNLTAPYVILAARRGIGNMPAIPRGEVNDSDMKLIADYLAAGPHPAAGAAK